MIKLFKSAALAAATAGTMAIAAPAAAASFDTGAQSTLTQSSFFEAESDADSWNQYRDRYYRDRDYRGGREYYRERNYRNSRTWRGRDGRTYCRRSNGTTGLIIGGAAGALLGRELDGGYNRSTGTILGAAGGALLGRSVDRNRRCR